MSEQDYTTPPVFNGFSSDGTIRSVRDLRPAHFLLKIEPYSLLSKSGGETYESGIFEAGGHRWNLCFYSKGNHQSGGNDHISLYLKLVDTKSLPRGWEVNAKFTFFVFDQLHDEYLSVQEGTIRRFHETKVEWVVPQLLPLEVFEDVSNGYLVDDCCVFGVEVFVLKHTGRMDCISMVKKPFNNTYSWKIKKVSTLDKAFYPSVRGILRKLLAYPKVDSVSSGKGLGGTSNQKVYAEHKNQLDIKSKLECTTETIRSTRDLRPAHFLFKIESYSLLCETGAETYGSGIFEAGGHKWKLCFYPNGNHKSQGNNHISLHLKVVDTTSLPSGWEINAKFTFFVFDQLRDKYLTVEDGAIRHFHETKTEWGTPRLLSLDVFNDVSKGYLVDDCCVFGVEVVVLEHTGRMECLSMVKQPSNNIYTWEIRNFSALDKAFYTSEAFTIQGILWNLRLYPKGESNSKGDGISVYLYTHDNGLPKSNQKVYEEYKLKVKNQLDSKSNQERTCQYWFCGPLCSWGFGHMISLEDLKDTSKGYVSNDDTLILEVEFVVVSVTESFS